MARVPFTSEKQVEDAVFLSWASDGTRPVETLSFREICPSWSISLLFSFPLTGFVAPKWLCRWVNSWEGERERKRGAHYAWPTHQVRSLRAMVRRNSFGQGEAVQWKSCSKEVQGGMKGRLKDGLDWNWNALEPTVLLQTCDPRTQEAEAEGSLVGSQPGPNDEILSQKKSLRRINEWIRAYSKGSWIPKKTSQTRIPSKQTLVHTFEQWDLSMEQKKSTVIDLNIHIRRPSMINERFQAERHQLINNQCFWATD